MARQLESEGPSQAVGALTPQQPWPETTDIPRWQQGRKSTSRNVFSLRSDFVSGRGDVYPAPTAEIYDHIAKLKVRQTSRVATISKELESNLWHQGKLSLLIESLIHCVARTGLPLAGSTGFFVAACLGQVDIPTLRPLLALIGDQSSHSFRLETTHSPAPTAPNGLCDAMVSRLTACFTCEREALIG